MGGENRGQNPNSPVEALHRHGLLPGSGFWEDFWKNFAPAPRQGALDPIGRAIAEGI